MGESRVMKEPIAARASFHVFLPEIRSFCGFNNNKKKITIYYDLWFLQKRKNRQIKFYCMGEPVVPNLGNKILDEAKRIYVVAVKFPGFRTKSSMLCPVLSSKLEHRKRKNSILPITLCS